MKELLSRLARNPIPRTARIALCLFACAALLLYAYFAEGMPAFSPEHALRRAERRALIDAEGRVLAAKPQIRLNDNDTRVLAVEYGSAAAALFGTSRDSMLGAGWSAHNNGAFYIVAKSASGATVMAYPGYPTYIADFGDPLLIAVFDDFPEAVRAELTLSVETVSNYTEFSAVYTLEAQREHEGVFFFEIRNDDYSGDYTNDAAFRTSSESYALSAMADLADPWGAEYISNFADSRIPASVAFYGGDGGVIATVETEVAKALL